MTSAKFWDFLTPSPLVRIWGWSTVLNSCNLPYYIFFWANPPPALSADVIYGCPLMHCPLFVRFFYLPIVISCEPGHGTFSQVLDLSCLIVDWWMHLLPWRLHGRFVSLPFLVVVDFIVVWLVSPFCCTVPIPVLFLSAVVSHDITCNCLLLEVPTV